MSSFSSLSRVASTGSSGVLTISAAGSTPNSAGGSISGTVLTLQPADGTNPGLVTAGTQTLGGAKTWNGLNTFKNATFTADNNVSFSGGSAFEFKGQMSAILDRVGSDAWAMYENGFNPTSSPQSLRWNTSTGVYAMKGLTVSHPSATTIAPAGTTCTVDLSTGDTQTIDISGASGNVTATFTNPSVGGRYLIVVIGKLATTLTFATGAGAFKWPGGVAPTFTATTGKTDVLSLYYDGTNYYQVAISQNQ
jgi:hypothetical protein